MFTFNHRLPVLLAALVTLTFGSCKDDEEPAAPKPTATFTYTGGACQAACPVTFQNSSQNATTYSWNFGDNTTGAQADAQFTHTYAQAGVYQVQLTATGSGGTTTSTQTVTVGGCTPQIVQVTSNITAPTTWEACHVYVVTGSLGVSAALTVQPGAIVKFKPGAGLQLQPSGSLTAVGSATQPVFFTSIKDDTYGGDTNGDGNASTPARKDWASIIVAGQSGARLENCHFLYGGGDSPGSNYTLALHGVAATVRSCTFAHNAGGAPSMLGALSAERALVGTVLESNTFFDNEMPLRIVNLYNVDNSNTFQNPANAGQKNDFQGIWVQDTSGTAPQLSWAETELPFVLGDTHWDAPLTLQPGVLVKLLPDAEMHIKASARLLARGNSTQPVVFTSIKDDAHGGDTNHDGAATTPAKKDWASIILDGTTGSEFDHCELYYGGDGGTVLDLAFSSARVTNSTFAHNGEDVTSLTKAALDASYATAATVLQGNAFYDNVRPLSITSSFDLDDSNTFHNPANAAQKNQFQGIFTYWNSNVSKPNVSWAETEVAYVNIETIDLTVGHTLQVANNVTVKMASNTAVTCRTGAAQLLNPTGTGVAWTSYQDDSRGGDSNGNGAANGPVRGDWDGIYVDDSRGQWMTWSSIYYATH